MTDPIEDPVMDDDFEPAEEVLEPVKAAKSGVGLKTVLLCSALASILGMVGGGILAKNLTGPGETMVAEVSQADLDSLRTALDGLKSRTRKLEDKQADILKAQNTVSSSASDLALSADGPPDMAEFSAELLPLFEDIENRLGALENRSGVSMDSATNASEATDHAKPADEAKEGGANEDGVSDTLAVQSSNVGSSAIVDRSEAISALTASLSDLETRITAQSKKYIAKTDLQALKKRVAKLEADFEKPPVLIPPFPREAVMDVLTGKSDEDGGWLSGLLGDEVRVVDAETVMRLDRIEKFVEAGDINAIKKELVYLPADAKPVIDGWLAQFEQSE